MIKTIIIIGLIMLFAMIFYNNIPFSAHRPTCKEILINPDSYSFDKGTQGKHSGIERLKYFASYLVDKAKIMANGLIKQLVSVKNIPRNLINKKNTEFNKIIDQINSPAEKR